MKIAPIAATLAAAIGFGAITSPVAAQSYGDFRNTAGYACQQTKHQSQAAGGILGAIAGAVIGSNLAAHGGGRTGGALIGAAAGAAVGSNIGVSSAHDSGACQAAYRGYAYEQPVYATRSVYEGDAQYGAGQYGWAQRRRDAYHPDGDGYRHSRDAYRPDGDSYRYSRDTYRSDSDGYRYSRDDERRDGLGYGR